jgi:hypothetical protein
VRQFVVTFPVQLRLWMARSKSLCAKVCEKVCAELTAHLQLTAGSGQQAWKEAFRDWLSSSKDSAVQQI